MNPWLTFLFFFFFIFLYYNLVVLFRQTSQVILSWVFILLCKITHVNPVGRLGNSPSPFSLILPIFCCYVRDLFFLFFLFMTILVWLNFQKCWMLNVCIFGYFLLLLFIYILKMLIIIEKKSMDIYIRFIKKEKIFCIENIEWKSFWVIFFFFFFFFQIISFLFIHFS